MERQGQTATGVAQGTQKYSLLAWPSIRRVQEHVVATCERKGQWSEMAGWRGVCNEGLGPAEGRELDVGRSNSQLECGSGEDEVTRVQSDPEK